MSKVRVRIGLKNAQNTGAYALAVGETWKTDFSEKELCKRIDALSYAEKKLVSGLAANLLNGVRVVPDTDYPAVNALLRFLKGQDRGCIERTTRYINKAIVEINEAENKPTGRTREIFKEMMDW
jgi:acylphosphatase